jgi:hypothetical protein
MPRKRMPHVKELRRGTVCRHQAGQSAFKAILPEEIAAHGEHEKRTGGRREENRHDWYAAYMVAEQSSGEPPQ